MWTNEKDEVLQYEQEPFLQDEKEPALFIHAASARQSRYRQLLFAMIPIFSTAALVVWIYFVLHVAASGSNKSTTDVCLTSECVLASAEILRSRSPNYESIDPCDDFRSYMCEGFDATHDLRSDQSEVLSLSVMAEENQMLLKHILEAPRGKSMTFGKRSDEDGTNFAKIHDAYEACLNEETVAQRGVAPLVELVKTIREQFGLKDSYSKVFPYLLDIDVQPLVQMEIRADDKNPEVNVLFIGAPQSFGLPAKQYYEDEDLVRKYTHMIQDVHVGLQQDHNGPDLFLATHDATATSMSLVEFEQQLVAISPSEEDREDVTKYYNLGPLKNITDALPSLDIPGLIASQNPEFKPHNVVIGAPEYVAKLARILQDTDRSTIKSYVTWKVIQRFANFIESDAVKPLKQFNNVLSGKQPDAKPERWRTCLRHVDGGLGWILSRFFVEKAFSEDAKKYGDEIILDIKAEFIRKLDAAEWMTKDVRKVAIDKVHNIIQKIGYPTASPDIRDPAELARYYDRVKVSNDNYFNNTLSMVRNDVQSSWEKATEPVDKNEWGMTASTVNAYYNPAGNEIVFPAGIMQPAIFYPPTLPSYLSYGPFGAVAGHELSHAFDSSGRHYDQNGNYTDWWDEATVNEFKHKTECFINEYANFTVAGPDGKPHHVNGRLTLGENLADAGGLSAAFNAWKLREVEKPALFLPGLQEYTKEQLFFLSFGKVWCSKTRPEELLRRVYTDPHSPNAARVLLTVANSGEFRESFQCKQKEATCKLW